MLDIEKIDNNRITISFSSGTDIFGIQRLIDYANYLEATSKAKQSDVDKLADEVNQNWREKNRFKSKVDRFNPANILKKLLICISV